MKKYELAEKVANQIGASFTNQVTSVEQDTRIQTLLDAGRGLALTIATITPPSRSQSLALTHLEEAIMHAARAIAQEDPGSGH